MKFHIYILGIVTGVVIAAFTMSADALRSDKIISDLRTVTITSYNPVKEQCDSTPHITASGKHYGENCLALSRDLLYKFDKRGVYYYGDTVYVTIPFIVKDTMNKRIHSTIDILLLDKDNAILIGRKRGWIYKIRK